MSQHDYNIANQAGALVRADINSLVGAIASLNSGPAAPSVTFANMLWYDETNSLLKIRNPGNTAWITFATISGSTMTFSDALLLVAASGDWFGTSPRIPRIATDGIMEIGGSLDFHPDAAGTEDNRLRVSRATGANGVATFTQTGTGGLNLVPGTGGLKKDNVILQGLPIGTPLPWPGSSAPSLFIFGYGQNISRTTYADYFAVVGTTYGSGDGSTTFGVPDYRGRVIAGKDDMGGVSANRLTGVSGGVDGDVLGGVGGVETHTLTAAQMPAHTHTGAGATSGVSANHTHPVTASGGARRGTNGGNVGTNFFGSSGDSVDGGTGSLTTGTISVDHFHGYSFTTDSTGSGGAHNNVQPTIIHNQIIFVGV